MTDNPNAGAAPKGLRDYLRILRRGWIVIMAACVVGAGAGGAYSALLTPEYSASSKVFVSTTSGNTIQDLAQGNTFTEARVATYAELATTPAVLKPAIDVLGLHTSPQALASTVSASAPLNTTLIEISVTSGSARQAASLANAIASSLTTAVQGLEETRSSDSSPVKLTLVQRAAVASAPVRPKIPLNVGLGLIIGGALGIGWTVLRDALDTRVRNEDDVANVTNFPIIGGIAYDAQAAARPLVVHADPSSARAESFRMLRTNLQFLDIGKDRRTFVVTSALEREGKSTTVSNLAIAMAESGARVLLIDADLRRPAVANYMGVEGAAGLTDLLIGRVDVQDVLHAWGRNQLYVLPAGQVPPNPSELLGSRKMDRLLEMLEHEFDYIFLDAPPLLPVTDAAVLATRATGALLVVAAGRTRKNQLRAALSAITNVGANVSGVAMTMLPTKGPDAYGYERYGARYGALRR